VWGLRGVPIESGCLQIFGRDGNPVVHFGIEGEHERLSHVRELAEVLEIDDMVAPRPWPWSVK
jgi:hypothetical protein